MQRLAATRTTTLVKARERFETIESHNSGSVLLEAMPERSLARQHTLAHKRNRRPPAQIGEEESETGPPLVVGARVRVVKVLLLLLTRRDKSCFFLGTFFSSVQSVKHARSVPVGGSDRRHHHALSSGNIIYSNTYQVFEHSVRL